MGAVQQPGMFPLSDIRGMPTTTIERRGKEHTDIWRGIAFDEIIRRVEPREAAKRVLFRCLKHYGAAFDIEQLESGRALLAFELNGEPLSVAQGGPLRLVFAADPRAGVQQIAQISFEVPLMRKRPKRTAPGARDGGASPVAPGGKKGGREEP